MDRIHDSRFAPFVDYDKKFLLWWGILLYCFKLGSRRQLDYDMRDLETHVLDNINRLAHTRQESLPVNKTLPHFLGHAGSPAIADLRSHVIRRLIRMKALDDYRLEGDFVVAVDGTGYLTFRHQHCSRCLTKTYNGKTCYFHPVLEAKLLTTSGLALSIGSEFIENPVANDAGKTPRRSPMADYETIKQDCELKAFIRLAKGLKKQFPQTPLCISGDALFACGTSIQLCNDNRWSFVFTFKPGRTRSVWEDFKGLLTLLPENSRRITLPDGIVQHYRWVNDLPFEDSEGRTHNLNAVLCEETNTGKTTTFAWITSYRVNANNVAAIAEKGGRIRFKIENEGFNIQKNSGLNLEHAYCFGEDALKAFYYLMQIAHIILQMVEKGSLLKKLAQQYAADTLSLFGSLKNIARRLLECFRYFSIPNDDFNAAGASSCHIRIESG
jgi:hypothetical protein